MLGLTSWLAVPCKCMGYTRELVVHVVAKYVLLMPGQEGKIAQASSQLRSVGVNEP